MGPLLPNIDQGNLQMAQVPPNTPVSKAFSKAWLLARWAGRDAGWAGHIPRCYVPPAGRAGAPYGDQTTAGPTGPMSGQARIMIYMRKRERKRRVKVPVKPAAPNRGRGRCACIAGTGLKIEGASDAGGFQELSMAHLTDRPLGMFESEST